MTVEERLAEDIKVETKTDNRHCQTWTHRTQTDIIRDELIEHIKNRQNQKQTQEKHTPTSFQFFGHSVHNLVHDHHVHYKGGSRPGLEQ